MAYLEAKEAYTGENENRKQIIIGLIQDCDNTHWLRCIYAFVTKLLGN